MDQQNLSERNLAGYVDSLFHSLENFTQNEGIIGKPVTQGNKTFLPVVSISIGYGGGNATMSKGSQSASSTMGAGASGTGTGALGLGAKLSTDAVIVIDDQNVSVMPINSSAGTIMDKIPQIISGMNQNKQTQGQTQPQP